MYSVGIIMQNIVIYTNHAIYTNSTMLLIYKILKYKFVVKHKINMRSIEKVHGKYIEYDRYKKYIKNWRLNFIAPIFDAIIL